MQCILDKLKCTWVRLEQSFWSYLSSQKKWGTFNGEKVLARFQKLLCIVWMHLFDSSIHCSKVNEIYCLNKSLWGLDIQNLCVRRLIACSVNIIPFSNISATWYYSYYARTGLVMYPLINYHMLMPAYWGCPCVLYCSGQQSVNMNMHIALWIIKCHMDSFEREFWKHMCWNQSQRNHQTERT